MVLKKILLVEDNPDDVELTKRAFSKGQYHYQLSIIEAKDGVEALKALAPLETNHPENGFSLILLDLHLPRVDGFEVLKHLKTHDNLRHIPVVILTSSNEKSDLNKAYSLGANSYIRKPVDFDAFSTSIENIRKYWLELNEGMMGA
jgi:two-component system, response regulator